MPFWAFNARKVGGPHFCFQLNFFQTFLFLPILFYINALQPFIIHFQIFTNQNHSSNLFQINPKSSSKTHPFLTFFPYLLKSLFKFLIFSKISPPHSINKRSLTPHSSHHSNFLFLSLFLLFFLFFLLEDKQNL